MIYMDHNATTPVLSSVQEAMKPYWGAAFGNASSAHRAGHLAREGVERARRIIAEAIGAKRAEIYFTSGGTESNNFALLGCRPGGKFPALAVSAIEHHSVLRTAEWTRDKRLASVLPVDRRGNVVFDALHGMVDALTADTPIVVSVMYGNNETGNVGNLEDLAPSLSARRFYLHTDAVQAFGKIPIHVDDLGVDMLSMSAHKINGPKGVGALYVRDRVEMYPLICGGHQERDGRAGTENVPGIVGFGRAVEIAMNGIRGRRDRLTRLTLHLANSICRNIPDVVINSYLVEKENIGNTLNVTFKGVDGEAVVMMMDQRDICISQGAACESGVPEPSHVLKAMGRTDEEASGGIRFSLGRGNTEVGVDAAVAVLVEVIDELRG